MSRLLRAIRFQTSVFDNYLIFLFSSAERNYGGWCAYECTSDQVNYLQVDLGKAMTVTGVETQSVYEHNNWVESYTLSYSYDNIAWHDYKVLNKGKVGVLVFLIYLGSMP